MTLTHMEGSIMPTTTTTRIVRFNSSDTRSALYVDGVLDSWGDTGNIDERVAELTGLTVISSDDWLRGENQPVNIAPTLSDVDEFTHKEKLLAEAAYHAAEAERILAALDSDGLGGGQA